MFFITVTLISLTRVPMNVITCGALLCLHVDWVSRDKRLVFGACLVLCLMGEGVRDTWRRNIVYIWCEGVTSEHHFKAQFILKT